MAKKNNIDILNGGGQEKIRHSRSHNSSKLNHSGIRSPIKNCWTSSSSSPVSGSPVEVSLRGSPGFLSRHYAGCKWTEPPLPSSLPLPPQHWMQTTHHSIVLPFHHNSLSEHQDITNQLKVLLKVQA